MTTTLDIYTQRKPLPDSGRYRVFFRVTTKSGEASLVRAFDVDTKSAKEEPYKFAELIALKYILLHSPYIGSNRNGEGLAIKTSIGSIKKIQKQHTNNADMIIHGRFLQIRFSGAAITTSRRINWVQDFSGETHAISVRDCGDKPVKTHVGELLITRRAIERYSERMEVPSLDRAFRSLSRLLATSTWSVVRPPEPLLNSNKRTTETWELSKGTASTVNIVIVRSRTQNRVVTVLAA